MLTYFLASTYSLGCLSSIVSILPFSNDVNVTDQDGNTALHLAAISSKTECMRVLLRAGATDSLSLGMFIITAIFPFLSEKIFSTEIPPLRIDCEPAVLSEDVAKQQ